MLLQNGKIEIIKADKHSVGYKNSNEKYIFTEHIINVEEGMRVYLFSDGFTDQLGKEKGFPFGNKRTREALEESKELSMADQKKYLIKVLNEYSKGCEQNDDISFIGLRF